MKHLTGALAYAIAVLSVAYAASAPAHGPNPPVCGPAKDQTIAQRGVVRVFADHTHQYRPGVLGYVLACEKASHVTLILTSASYGRSFLMPGSVTIRGHLVAYGYDRDIGDQDATTDTFVQVTSTASSNGGVLLTALAGPRDANYPALGFSGKVTSTVIGPDGAIAWISCAGGRSIGSDLAVGRHALCQRPGRIAWVYVAKAPQGQGATAVTTRLDGGRGIAPLSLKAVGSTISWVDSGRVHTATLP